MILCSCDSQQIDNYGQKVSFGLFKSIFLINLYWKGWYEYQSTFSVRSFKGNKIVATTKASSFIQIGPYVIIKQFTSICNMTAINVLVLNPVDFKLNVPEILRFSPQADCLSVFYCLWYLGFYSQRNRPR